MLLKPVLLFTALASTALGVKSHCKYAPLENATWGLDLYKSAKCTGAHQWATHDLKEEAPGGTTRCSPCTALSSRLHGEVGSYTYTSEAWYLELRWYPDSKCKKHQIAGSVLGKQQNTDAYLTGVKAFQVCTP
ncbi:hypothetical protein BV22DRAFT_1131204 [Leucogyrophana mollusca]|uniref:Uncharacterized protein n=1 Tax=Leucogyrophana mollusca TaxID=85980 RepID=A0ACB8BAC2_9AGAM|nr:hypothetical protein BV22DRAFT_1131204 [Leucogyrophana mollusca]